MNVFLFNIRFGLSLRDSLLFDFGAMLMSKESFWVFGIDYLERCSMEGNGTIEIFLSKLNIKTERNALKVLNVIKGKGLIEAGMFILYIFFILFIYFF